MLRLVLHELQRPADELLSTGSNIFLAQSRALAGSIMSTSVLGRATLVRRALAGVLRVCIAPDIGADVAHGF